MMPLLMEQRILAGRVVDAEEKWGCKGDTKKSSAREGKKKQTKWTANIRGSSRGLNIKKMKGTEQQQDI